MSGNRLLLRGIHTVHLFQTLLRLDTLWQLRMIILICIKQIIGSLAIVGHEAL